MVKVAMAILQRELCEWAPRQVAKKYLLPIEVARAIRQQISNAPSAFERYYMRAVKYLEKVEHTNKTRTMMAIKTQASSVWQSVLEQLQIERPDLVEKILSRHELAVIEGREEYGENYKKYVRMKKENPNLSDAELARALGVCRERARQFRVRMEGNPGARVGESSCRSDK